MITLNDLLIKWNGKERGAQSRLAKALGRSRTNISSWVRGLQTPGEKIMAQLAKVLDVPQTTLEQCFKIIPKPESNPPEPALAPIPVLGNISSQIFPFSFDLQPMDYVQFFGVPGLFAIRVQGDHFKDFVSPGEILILRRQPFAAQGDIAMLKDWQGYTFKKISKEVEKQELVGIVMAVIRKF